MDNAYCGSMQQAQRRVYDMQRRAQAALGRTAEERGEEPAAVSAPEGENCARKTPSAPRVNVADTERLLLLLLAVMILRSGRGSAALAAALLYICM